MPSASSLYAVSGNQLIKLIKSVTSLVLKKVTTILRFSTKKRRLKNRSMLRTYQPFIKKSTGQNDFDIIQFWFVFPRGKFDFLFNICQSNVGQKNFLEPLSGLFERVCKCRGSSVSPWERYLCRWRKITICHEKGVTVFNEFRQKST